MEATNNETRSEKLKHIADIIMKMTDSEAELAVLVAQSMQTGYTLGQLEAKTA